MPTQLSHRVHVSHLSDTEIQSLQNFLQALAGKAIEAPTWHHIVYVQTKTGSYWRSAPGAQKLLEKLGPESFKLFGSLLSLGIEAYQNSQNSGMSPNQKMGRAFLDLLLTTTPLGLVSTGASIIWPEQTEQFKSQMFAPNPVTNYLADQIVKFGGKQFQDWSAKPNWIDFM